MPTSLYETSYKKIQLLQASPLNLLAVQKTRASPLWEARVLEKFYNPHFNCALQFVQVLHPPISWTVP